MKRLFAACALIILLGSIAGCEDKVKVTIKVRTADAGLTTSASTSTRAPDRR
jgi:hypothetical protein